MTKQYRTLSLREREILRYAGCRTEEEEMVRLMQECLQEAERCGVLSGQVCYIELPVRTEANLQNDFGSFAVCSEQLAKNLEGCKRVLLLAATAGVGIDRLIEKYGRIAPSKALMLQAIGAELVETICDRFGKEYEAEHNCILRPRFSPGYGDLPLETQKAIFAVLEPARRIGLTLNDSLLMSPSKSVTAFAGITDCDVTEASYASSESEADEMQRKCRDCGKQDCAFSCGR